MLTLRYQQRVLNCLYSKMFSTKHNECVGFDSLWKVTKTFSENGSQTTEFSTSDKQSNTNETTSKQSQTDQEINTKPSCPDLNKVALFLKRIYPEISPILTQISQSTIFEGYNLPEETEKNHLKLLQSVIASKEQKKLTSLAWNCTGAWLAVATAFEDHTSWCSHEGFVNLFKKSKDFSENPMKTFSCDSCISALSFHPTHPAILAAATLSGDLTVFNIHRDSSQKEDSILVKLRAHEDAITCLQWPNDVSTSMPMLATSSLDGRLQIWDFNNERVSLRIALNLGTIATLAFDFCPFQSGTFVAIQEGGFTVEGSILGKSSLKDPVVRRYEAIKARLEAVQFCRFKRNTFLTSSSDSRIRIYVLGQEEPVQVVFTEEAMSCVQWVPRSNQMVVGLGSSGRPQIYHLLRGLFQEQINDDLPKNSLSVMSISGGDYGVVACGTVHGQLQLWTVCWEITF